MAGNEESRHRRVAVVAVHGVANQGPGESARSVAGLLQRLQRADGGEAYGPCHEESLRIAIRPVEVADGGLPEDPGLAETVRQLRGYELGEPTPYETVRLSLVRLAKDDAPREHVDVYELYWADLSRARGGILRVLGELYQLVFHLPSLGRRALEEARAAARRDASLVPGAGALRVAGELQRLVTFLGAVVAPMLNLAAVLAGVAAFSSLLATTSVNVAYWLVAIVAIGALSAAVAGVLGAIRIGPRMVLGGTLATAGLALALAAYLDEQGISWCRDLRVVALAAMLAAGVALAIPILQYGKRRPIAVPIGIGSLVGALASFLVYAFFVRPWHHDGRHDGDWHRHALEAGELPREHTRRVLFGAVRTLEVVFGALNVTWILTLVAFVLFVVTTAVLSLRARIAARDPRHAPGADRMRRALGTARLTTAMSLLLFLLVTVPLGAGLVRIGANWLDLRHLPYHPFLPWLTMDGTASDFVLALPAIAVTPAAPLVGAVVLVAVVAFAVPLLPNALSEVRVPSGRRGGALFGLDVATQGAAFASFLMVVAILVYFGGVAITPLHVSWAEQLRAWTSGAMGALGTLLAGSAAGILVFQGRLRSFSLGFRPILDIALDVDNYLRERPRTTSVRAAISIRCASLLRYLAAKERAYDHVILVAHSQGTVIAADHLRFLHHMRREHERPASLALFTMGSPLRQLYAARFPNLYHWAERDGAGPDPVAELGITTWVNAYRGGDYVGRALFAKDMRGTETEVSKRFVREESERPGPGTRDLYVGVGAHTHYWDEHAPVVARELDGLVGDVPPATNVR